MSSDKTLNNWIFIMPDSDFYGENECLITLPHPKRDEECQYLLREKSQQIFEIIKFYEHPRSWFVDNSVIQDGSLYFATRVDPLFIILPCLKATSTKYMSLEQILQEWDNIHMRKISPCITKQELNLITDVKEEHGLIVFKLNNEKVLSWLQRKVSQTKDQIEKDHSSNSENNLRYAFGLISDYISDEWIVELKDRLGITEEILESSLEEPACKKVKLDESLVGKPDEDYSKFVSKSFKTNQMGEVKLTAAQKSLAKVNTKGMKNISSFFQPPKKSK
ncbi:ribonuclease H2 subunit B-like isoform X3 [Xenia sp. Carnegie-2017]|uniref:ribonuclease H2 subunit B-like isoform X3 n=1 Tax=Xenia sp. Carnegie-2017 TaxID=2897299 RepID=UPI001F040509|nr:ribonuclease H2 subunit B-like isoform X3 [Xenia sp. Carnegie-2017]